MRTEERPQEQLHDELERWRGVGLIDTATEEAIERYEAKQDHPTMAVAEPARRIPIIAEAIAYLGAALAAAAVMTVVIDRWTA